MDGLREIEARLKRYSQKVDSVADEELKTAAESVLKTSNDKVPVASGRLKASGKIVRALDRVYEVQYDAPYAVAVHEDMEARHAHGEAKFLSKSLDTNRRGTFRKMAAELRSIR